jgi:hypothetical protein
MSKKVLAFLVVLASTIVILDFAIVFAASAYAAGGQNRYADELIEEGYQLCEQQGVKTVTVTVGDITIVLDCDDAPGPFFPGSDED